MFNIITIFLLLFLVILLIVFKMRKKHLKRMAEELVHNDYRLQGILIELAEKGKLNSWVNYCNLCNCKLQIFEWNGLVFNTITRKIKGENTNLVFVALNNYFLRNPNFKKFSRKKLIKLILMILVTYTKEQYLNLVNSKTNQIAKEADNLINAGDIGINRLKVIVYDFKEFLHKNTFVLEIFRSKKPQISYIYDPLYPDEKYNEIQ